MFTEQEIEKLMAEVILRTVKNSAFSTNIKDFCAENQIDRGKLMAKKLFRMLNATLFRIMMGIAQLVSFEEYMTMCIEIALITYHVANLEDGSPESIKRAHMGSPIGRKTKTRKFNPKKL